MDNIIEELNRLLENKQYAEAELMAHAYLDDHPNDSDVGIKLAIVFGRQEKYEEAETELNKIVALDGQNLDAILLLSLLKEIQKEYSAAEKILTSALKLRKKMGVIHYWLARINEYPDNKEKREYAVKHHYTQAVVADDPPIEAFLGLAAIETPHRAINILQSGIDRYPSEIELYLVLSRKLYLLDKFSECIRVIEIAISRGLHNAEFDCYLVLSNYQLKNYSLSLEHIDHLIDPNDKQSIRVRCLKGLLLCEMQEHDQAEEILERILVEDVGNFLQNAGHFILICCYLRDSINVAKAENLIEELPFSETLSYPIVLEIGNIGIFVDKYFLEAINGILEKGTSQEIIKKTRYFRASYNYDINSTDNSLSSDDLRKARDDLISVLDLKSISHQSIDYIVYDSLSHIARDLKLWNDAAYYYFMGEVTDRSTDYSYELEPKVLESIFSASKGVQKLLNSLDEIISTGWQKAVFAKKCLGQLISFFFSKSRYDLVIKLAEKFTYTEILTSESVFEVAYAYAETGKKKQAKLTYRAYLRDVGESSSAANNLGLLEEESGNLIEAAALFNKAIVLDSDSEIAKNNLTRVNKRIKKDVELKEAYQKAASLFLREDELSKNLIARLYSQTMVDNVILCTKEKLIEITGIKYEDIEKKLDGYISKRYFDEIEDTDIDFDGIRLRVNPVMIPLLEKEVQIIKEKDSLKFLMNDLMSENLDKKYGYNQTLLDNLKYVNSAELATMLERDLYEIVRAFVIQSYKSILIMCGSVVEAILLDKLKTNEDSAMATFERIMQKRNIPIKGRDRKIENWSLENLIDVALEEKIISENLYHWAHGIRGFRNLVHPAAEQRKSIEISRENAEMAWNAVKRLLTEIKPKASA